MTELERAVKAIDSDIFELGEAFEGLQDADVWTRPHPRLLSIGELACHMAYGEAKSFLSDHTISPIITDQASYYKKTVDAPFQLDLGAADLLAEVKKVHEACKASIEAANPALEDKSPYRQGWTWGYVLEYMAFHFAYHTGQMYSVRHLMGHETADN
ncbi:MAG: DinB family protein [Armatimonadetes bacterium]|nr:DinB family protein [Armatimonadota bacterium]